MKSHGGSTSVPIWRQILEPSHWKPQNRYQNDPEGSNRRTQQILAPEIISNDPKYEQNSNHRRTRNDSIQFRSNQIPDPSNPVSQNAAIGQGSEKATFQHQQPDRIRTEGIPARTWK